MIIDYSFWRPAVRDLAGVNGAIRYIASDPAKCVAADELAYLWECHIGTGLVFEDAAERAAEGGSAGREDGQFVVSMARHLGVPPGRPVYAAVDFDVPDYAASSPNPALKLGPVGDYLRQFKIALGGMYEAGAYGGFWLVSRALNAQIVSRTWQTAAWSAGQIDHRICLYQPGTHLANGQADLNLAGWRDWGQFRMQAGTMIVGASA